MSLSQCLAQLSASSLSSRASLPGLSRLVPAAATAGLQQLRSLHGSRFWCCSIEQQQQQQQQQSLAALSTARFIAAQAQHVHSDDDAAGSSSLLQAQDSPWYDAHHGAAAASSPQAVPHAADRRAAGGSLSASGAGSTAALEAASNTAGPSSSIADHHISAEGDVVYPEGALLRHIEEHWRQLQACPSAAAYTQRISFDEFGHRYIQQLEREELSRSRALAQLRKEIAADARHGRSYKQGGGVANRLVSAWLPLVAQAIEEEQVQVLQSGGDRAARQRRDRPNYGPYLLLLSAEDMAHITLQTVLSRIATALPDNEEGDLSVRGAAGISGLSAAQGHSNSGYSSSDALSGNSSGAVMAPAVLLADFIGRAVNSRVKYLRFKHHQREWDAKEAQLQQQQQRQRQQQQQELGEKLSSSLQRYSKANSKEAAEYAEGRSRLEAYAALRSLRAASRKAAKSALADVHWDQEARIKVGAALLALLVENSSLPSGLPGTKPKPWNGAKSAAAQQQGQPAAAAAAAGSGNGSRSAAGAGDVAAFEYLYVKSGLKQQSYVRASQALVGVLLADRGLAAHLLTKVPPMLVPPLPWSGYNTGGYLTSRHWIMRTRFSAALQRELKEGLKEQRYSQVLDALNVLGNTSWRINRQVYDTMAALWAARSTAGGLPQQTPLKTPPPPSAGYRLVYEGAGLSARSGGWSKLERRGHVLACDDVRRLNRNMASLKADFLLKLRVAEEYVDAPEFYYPHTLDFRGRAYPLHPSLHHLGDDSCRGLLLFAQGVKLGPQGLDWLHVHLANVWGQGQDKLSFDGRRAFARLNLATILSVAADPLRCTWWQQAEKPWQALAACCEIAGALTSMDPASYVSHLPVHMDGSCNGLQHYAALGRDEAGGRAVNLLPSDMPQDVYKGVAAIVARRVAADAAAGVLEAQRSAALVDRKVVKQTVMTSVYGVTPVGARAQIENRLKERRTDMKQKAALVAEHGSNSGGSDNGWLLAASGMATAAAAAGGVSSSGIAAGAGGDFGMVAPGMRDEYSWMDDKDVVWQVSKYLADLTLDAIGEMFGSARAIMAWLADCARVVAASNAPVSWSSPLGLPIMQPYHKLSLTSIQTATQSFSVVSNDSHDSCQWLKARQRSAFPPNFIHSIDSTHMMMTALACSQCGITFAGVHDSFWTHAGHVPSMNKLLRDKFVELHTREPDLLQDLLKQLQSQHPGLEFPPIPERGQLAVARVKNSRYFFS